MRNAPLSAPQTPVGIIAGFASRIARPDHADPGENVVEAVRERVFDTLGATLVGLRTPEGRVLTRLHGHLTGNDAPCPVIEGARLLVGATRSTEIDDIDVASCTTPGSVVIPTALCVAASLAGTDERQLAGAIAAGYDAMIRLGRAIDGANALHAGVWPTYAAAPFAAAAVTSSLHGMDEAQTIRALSLALARSSKLWSAPYGDSAFRFHALGSAAAEGIEAALAAQAGVEARPEVLDALAEATGARFDAAAFNEDFSGWKVLDVDTKLFPTSRQALASVEAFQRQLPLPRPVDDIDEIVVHVPGAYRDMIDRPASPGGRIESMLSVQYQVALAAFDRELLYDVCRESLPRDARYEQLSRSIRVRAESALTARFPRTWGSRVDIRWRGGKRSSCEVLDPAGSRLRRLDWHAFRAKLDRIVAASGLTGTQTARNGGARRARIPGEATEALMSRCQAILRGASGKQDGDPGTGTAVGVAHELLGLAQASCGSRRPIGRIAPYAGNNDG